MMKNLFKNVPISDATKEYIGDFKPTTDADFKWIAKNLKVFQGQEDYTNV